MKSNHTPFGCFLCKEMKEIIKNIYVGNQEDCFYNQSKDFAVIHACKHPCHKTAVGYGNRNLQKTHKHYLTYINGKHLYLNMIDSNSSYFPEQLFYTSLRFIKTFEKKNINVLIHCNQGMSRAPSIAMLYIAKEMDIIDNSSYDAARDSFYPLYQKYIPNPGIDKFLRKNWKKFI